jgi:hypothetical protein
LPWYVWRLEQAADNETAILAATVEAEIRYAKIVKRAPADLTAGAVTGKIVLITEERDKRIAQEYRGLSPIEVSVIETHRAGRCDVANVRKVRLAANLDPETGTPVASRASHEGSR